MSCLSERIAGAIIFLLSGYAFAGDLAIDSPEEMTVASIAPMPIRPLPPFRNRNATPLNISRTKAVPFTRQSRISIARR